MHKESLAFFEDTDILEDASQLQGNFAKKLSMLSRSYPREAVADALELIELQKTNKFSRASEMWFDREGLEMATPEFVARHRASRFGGRIVDLCCGIGGDSVALAARGQLLAFDSDPMRVEMTRHNLEVYEVDGDVKTLDITRLDLNLLNADWFFFDPQRRGSASPPLEGTLERIRETGAEFAVKMAPSFSGEGPVEWVSLNHELREACLWSSGERLVTVLPSGESLVVSGINPPEVTDVGGYLLEPDPAVIVAGAFGELAEKYPCTRIDQKIAYLTSDRPYDTSFFSSQLEVLDVLSGDLSRVKAALRKNNIGTVSVKTRGFPVDVERLRHDLSSEGEPGVVVFTRLRDRRAAMICRRQNF